MSNDIYKMLERIAISLEGILSELKRVNHTESMDTEREEEIIPITTTIANTKPFNKIEQYLESKGIEVFEFRELTDIEPLFIKIANSIGTSYSAVEPLIKEIKRNLANGQKFTLCVKEYSPKEITSMCGLAVLLKEHKFLKEYVYRKSPHFLITARPENSAQFHNFYTGQWLEYYVASVVRAVFTSRRGSRTINVNTKVKTGQGADFEFDVLAMLGEEKFWIECKTGEYKKYISKYEKIAKKLGFDASHMFLVIAGIDEDTVKALNATHNITICNVENFKAVFEKTLDSIMSSK